MCVYQMYFTWLFIYIVIFFNDGSIAKTSIPVSCSAADLISLVVLYFIYSVAGCVAVWFFSFLYYNLRITMILFSTMLYFCFWITCTH